MLELANNALRLLGFALGTALHVLLAVLLVKRRNRMARAMLAAVVSGGVWHAAGLLLSIHRAVALEGGTLPAVAQPVVRIAGLVTPVALVHAALVWTGVHPLLAAPVYLVVALGWLVAPQPYVACVVTAAAVLFGFGAARRAEPGERRFGRVFGASLLVLLAGAAAGEGSGALVAASLAPAVVFSHFIYHNNLFDLLLSRRTVFTLVLAALSALYLLGVRVVADSAQIAFEVFGSVVEVLLVLAAAIVWLPLYAWMTRVLGRRTELYTDFSKRVIEETTGILDFSQRVQFLADGVGRTFGLRRVLLVTCGEGRVKGAFGSREEPPPEALEALESLAREHRTEVVHVRRTENSQIRALLASLGYNYLFPLWYEDRLTGLLLVDPSPRLFLDEYETIFLGLSRQISQSIETSRLIDRQIGLEKELLAQQHLASLGTLTATIAHEVKNPLSSIRTLAQLMREDPEVAVRYEQDLAYIVGETDRLNTSVRQLLTYARPAPAGLARAPVLETLQTLTRTLALEHAANHIRIETRLDPALRQRELDRQALEQIVLNLVLNAVHASGPEETVSVEAATEPGGEVAISITDEGPGIPPEMHGKVFEPFFTTKQAGTGLGLAIVKKNVHHLGGRIELASPVKNSRGTRVTVTLPAS